MNPGLSFWPLMRKEEVSNKEETRLVNNGYEEANGRSKKRKQDGKVEPEKKKYSDWSVDIPGVRAVSTWIKGKLDDSADDKAEDKERHRRRVHRMVGEKMKTAERLSVRI